MKSDALICDGNVVVHLKKMLRVAIEKYNDHSMRGILVGALLNKHYRVLLRLIYDSQKGFSFINCLDGVIYYVVARMVG